jgi:NAD(P)-dependent dehydrogenase (short-subunit alcohol dehydrogenase family)
VNGSLDARTAIVTGGARGIGRAVALHLAECGARVVVADNGSLPGGADRDDRPAREAADEIVAAGGEAFAQACDVTLPAEVDTLVSAAIDRWGRLDILVNAAGNLRIGTIADTTDDDWDAVVQVHLRGTFNTSRAAARHWVERGDYGRLVNFSSLAGISVGYPAMLAYSAAKAGIIGLTRAAANYLAPYHVTANCVSPVADTRMGDSVRVDAAPGEVVVDPARDPRHVAPLVAFLASPEAANVTGRILGAKGGRYTLWSEPAEELVVERDFLTEPEQLRNELIAMCAHLSPFDLPAPSAPVGPDWREQYGHMLPLWDGGTG